VSLNTLLSRNLRSARQSSVEAENETTNNDSRDKCERDRYDQGQKWRHRFSLLSLRKAIGVFKLLLKDMQNANSELAPALWPLI